MLLANGFDVLVVDRRNFGRSDGQWCIYVYREKYNVMRCVDWLLAADSPCVPIGIAGSCLGALVAIKAMSIDQLIHFGIAESPFASLHNVSLGYAVYRTGMNAPELVNTLLAYAEAIGKYGVNSVVSAHAIRRNLAFCCMYMVQATRESLSTAPSRMNRKHQLDSQSST